MPSISEGRVVKGMGVEKNNGHERKQKSQEQVLAMNNAGFNLERNRLRKKVVDSQLIFSKQRNLSSHHTISLYKKPLKLVNYTKPIRLPKTFLFQNNNTDSELDSC